MIMNDLIIDYAIVFGRLVSEYLNTRNRESHVSLLIINFEPEETCVLIMAMTIRYNSTAFAWQL